MATRKLSALVLGALLAATGCFTIDAKLMPTGQATMKLSYVMERATLPMARRDLEGPHVKVNSAEWVDDHANFDLSIDDVQKMSSSKSFSRTTVAVRDGASEHTKELTITIRNPKPTTLPSHILDRLGRQGRLTVELPGDVVSSNATSVNGRTATWTIPTEEFLAKPEIVFNAVYKEPPAPAPSSP